MNEANGMSADGTMDRAIRAYADQPEPWKVGHDEVKSCWALEDAMVTGRSLFRGLCELDAMLQGLQAKRGIIPPPAAMAGIEQLFNLWLKRSEKILTRAEIFIAKGHEIEGYDEFHHVVEEARATVGNLELEGRMPSIEEMAKFVRSENPDSARYEN